MVPGKIFFLMVLFCAAVFLTGCAPGFSRKGYQSHAGQLASTSTNSPVAIQCDKIYSTNEVVVLGSIHAYDTGFSFHCDEASVLAVFQKDAQMLGADVIDITDEKQPNLASTCYRAKAQFLRFKDRNRAKGIVSDPRYAPDLVDQRSQETASDIMDQNQNYEAVMFGGIIGGAVGGAIAGAISASDSKSEASMEELRQRAEDGDATAQRLLAEDYEYGRGVEASNAEAAKWYQLAANRNDAIAENNLGSYYEYGYGVTTNYEKAVALYRQSAAQGFPMAECNLGYMYDFGLGLPVDKVAADKWYWQAADQGYPVAMLNLGMNYVYGEGIDRDLPRAYMWLDCAQHLALLDSHDDLEMNAKSRINLALNNLKQHMTPEQISEGEKMSQEWLAVYGKAHNFSR